MLSQTYFNNIDQIISLCNVVPAWLMQHCMAYFPYKSCLLAVGQHCTGDFFVQYWPRQIQTTLSIIFMRKFVYGLWTKIVRVIFYCNVDSGRSRQHCIWLFSSEKMTMRLGQYCISNFLVQFCLRRIWATLIIQYSYAMLSQLDRYNIVQVILLRRVVY